MEQLAATAGLLTVAVITPGPNNLIVLREAAHRGWKAVLPLSVGVVLGGLAILMLVVVGASSLFRVDPGWTRVLSVAACLLLVAFGAVLIKGSAASNARSPAPTSAQGLGGLGGMFLFQFLNPKSWILVVAVVSSIGPSPALTRALPQLIALFLVIPAASLMLWALAGSLAERYMERRGTRAWLDRVTGGLLIGFALLLLLGGVDGG